MNIREKAGGASVQQRSDHWYFEIVVASLGVGAAAIAVAIDDLFNPDVLEGMVQWGAILFSVLAAYLVSGIVLVLRSWDVTPKNHDPGTEEKPLFRAAFAWTILFLAILAWASFGKENGAYSYPWTFDLTSNGGHQILFGAMLGIAFIPLLFGFHLVAVEATENTGRKSYLSDPDEEISWLGLGLTFGVSLLVCAGAWAAGKQMFTMSDNFGLMAVAVVVASFLVFIIAANILGFREPRESGESRKTKHKTVSGGITQSASELVVGLDAGLVRLLAPLSGATLPGMISGKTAIVFIMLPLSALGFALPPPVGLFPIGFAIVLILSMGRRWAWVEDDREKALRLQTTRSDKFRIGFNNDMRDEALLGYAFLFVLVPLGLRQIQLHFDFFAPHDQVAAHAAANSASIVDWLNFFGGELAKGVPIVDWFDIYDIQQERPFEPKDASGRHIIFGSRLMIDIVIIAALLQAIGIMQRNKGQENLFKSGQVDFFDPFMEKKILSAAYQTPNEDGDAPLKPKWLQFFKDHRKNSKDLDRGDFFYNPRRLNELSIELRSDGQVAHHRMRTVIDWLSQGLVTGTLLERGEKLILAHRNLIASESSDNDDPAERRKFERYFDDLVTDFRFMPTNDLSMEEYQVLSALLAQVATDRSLDVQRARAFKMLGSKGGLASAMVLAARVVRPEDGPPILGLDDKQTESWCVKRQGRYQDRGLAVEQLFAIKTNEAEIPKSERSQFNALHRRVIDYIRNKDVQGVQELLELLLDPPPEERVE